LARIITDRKSKTSVKIREIRGLFFRGLFFSNQGEIEIAI